MSCEAYVDLEVSIREMKEYDAIGLRADPGSILLSSHQLKTHSVGPFGNNLRTGCSLTRNSYGVPQNQVSASRRGILLYL